MPELQIPNDMATRANPNQPPPCSSLSKEMQEARNPGRFFYIHSGVLRPSKGPFSAKL